MTTAAASIARYALRIYNLGLTTTSGGNISVLDGGSIWLTPKGTDKGSLSEDIMAHARFVDGKAQDWEGEHMPTTEWPFHEAIYAVRDDIKAVIHSHPPCLQAYAIGHGVPDTRVLLAPLHVCGKVAFSPYKLPGSKQLGDVIAAEFKAGASCVMMENHGVVIGGRDIHHAFSVLEELEFCCRLLVRAACLGPIKMPTAFLMPKNMNVNENENENADIAALRSPPRDSDSDSVLRAQLRLFIRRAYQHRLFTTSVGVISARSPSREREGGFWTMRPGSDPIDADGDAEGDAIVWIPDVDTHLTAIQRIHREIFRQHPSIMAAVSAHPTNISAFGVVPSAPLKFHSTPEGFLVVGNVIGVEADGHHVFGDASASAGAGVAESIARLMDPANASNLVLVRGDLVHVAGDSLLRCFDRLEVLESVAESAIDAGLLGRAGVLDADRSTVTGVLMTDESVHEFQTEWIGFKAAK